MALLDVPATKSALLALRGQLAFAEEGYALLDQKRELLLLELTARRARAAGVRAEAEALLAQAGAALREATLAAGGAALDRAALGAPRGYGLEIKEKRLMGVRLPEGAAAAQAPGAAFGPGAATAAADAARRYFLQALAPLAALAGLETSTARLARELKKTQRRCNALSKKVIPDSRETIAFLAGALEEREREAYVILRIIRDKLRLGRG